MPDDTGPRSSALRSLLTGALTGQSAVTPSGEPKVFWGLKSAPRQGGSPPRQIGGGATWTRGTPGSAYAHTTGSSTPMLRDERGESEARAKVYDWYGSKDFDRWGDTLLDLGLIEDGEQRNLEVLDEWWQRTIDESIKFTAAGKSLTPWMVVRALAKTGAGFDGAGGRGGGVTPFSGDRKTRSMSVDLTDPKTAKGIINDALSRRLGRAATDEEIRRFTEVINSAERDNPRVTDTTTTYEEDRAVAQSSTTSGGTNPVEVVDEQAMQAPEYGAYQSASTYFNALLGTIGTVGGN